MADENNEFMTSAATASSEFELLETGAYSGICVGLTKREFKKFKSEETEPKFQFIFQVVDGDTKHYLRSLPFRNVINEKSNLFQFLNSWLGVTLEKASAGIDLGKVVGLKAQLVVDVQERDGKSYNVISNVLKAKKNDPVAFIEDDAAPAFLNKGPFICSRWVDGLSFAEPSETKAEVTDEDLVRMSEQQVAASSDDDESPLPF